MIAIRRPRNVLVVVISLGLLAGLVAIGLRLWAIHQDTEAADQAVAAVKSFDPKKDASLDRLNAAAQKRSSVVAAVVPYLHDPNLDRRFAAIYVAALAAQNSDDARLLSPALNDPTPVFRAIAAGSLAGLGEVSSIPVLIDSLSGSERLPYSDPPRQVADLAREALEAYTGQSFSDQQAWRSWWDSVKTKLHWNGSGYVV